MQFDFSLPFPLTPSRSLSTSLPPSSLVLGYCTVTEPSATKISALLMVLGDSCQREARCLPLPDTRWPPNKCRCLKSKSFVKILFENIIHTIFLSLSQLTLSFTKLKKKTIINVSCSCTFTILLSILNVISSRLTISLFLTWKWST